MSAIVDSSVLVAHLDSGPPPEENAAQDDLMQLNMERFSFEPFADCVWALRHNMTSYDAWYVTLAEALKPPLATLEEFLSKSKGVTCEFITPKR